MFRLIKSNREQVDIIIDLSKNPTETEEQYLWRIGQLVDSGEIESWESVNQTVNREILGEDEEKYRTESAWRKSGRRRGLFQ